MAQDQPGTDASSEDSGLSKYIPFLGGGSDPDEGSTEPQYEATRVDRKTEASTPTPGAAPLLKVTDLHTQFETDQGTVHAVDGVSFEVEEGETVALVGESGSGKTITSESVTRLFKSPPGYITEGSVTIHGDEVTGMSDTQLRQIRGQTVSHIFQNPQNALNPVYTVGWQIAEALTIHQGLSDEEARERAIELLSRVGIPDAGERVDDYPHEFSGGMKQRVIIAIALACDPDLLVADEPTTALDVTIQAQILNLFDDLQEQTNMGMLFITHDLGVVAEVADRVVVMYAGKVMERGPVEKIFNNPAHPYTQALLECLPGSGSLGGISGSLPDPMNPPDGCRFADRCPYMREECTRGEQPAFHAADTRDRDEYEHEVSCVHYRGTNTTDTALSDAGTDDTAAFSDGGHDQYDGRSDTDTANRTTRDRQ